MDQHPEAILPGDKVLQTFKVQVVHGDFTLWNLRFHEGRLTGILDFELAHRDHRVLCLVMAREV